MTCQEFYYYALPLIALSTFATVANFFLQASWYKYTIKKDKQDGS